MIKNVFTGANLSKIIHQISFHPDDRANIFLGLSPEARATVLLRLTRHIQHDLLAKISDDELAITLEQLDPDEATDVVQVLSLSRQKKIIERLSDELKRGVQILVKFDPETAAGLVNLDYIQVDEQDSIAQVAKHFKTHEKRTGRLPAIIALRDGRVSGYVPGHELGFAHPAEKVKKYVRKIATIRHDASHDDVIKVFKDHPHNKVVVAGEKGNVLGIIYSDDVLRIIEDQESASLYDFAGVHEEESVSDTAPMKVKFRYKWLIINLGTAFLAAFTVSLFDATISKYVLLAVYMPIVAGMGGNAATQTLAVLVRGIALKQIELKNAWHTLVSEVGAGFINGLINGVIVALIVYFFNHDLKVAIVLSLAMVTNLVVAGIFGTLVPLIMERLGKDPATSATIFITTATDVLGFMVFLGLATMVLR